MGIFSNIMSRIFGHKPKTAAPAPAPTPGAAPAAAAKPAPVDVTAVLEDLIARKIIPTIQSRVAQ